MSHLLGLVAVHVRSRAISRAAIRSVHQTATVRCASPRRVIYKILQLRWQGWRLMLKKCVHSLGACCLDLDSDHLDLAHS